MNINRHNYEEFFLLYVDNELTVEQRKEVELFVQQQPDLEEELMVLQQSKLIPEQIEFDSKELLMRNENSLIDINNYEEYFTLYVDDELNPEERKAVEEFAGRNAGVKKELALFGATRLPAEEIAFPDKNLLYRSEEKVRIVRMQWWKVAVAAVLIIAAGLAGFSILDNKSTPPPAVAKGQTPTPSVKPAETIKQQIEQKQEQAIAGTSLPKETKQPTKEIKNNNKLAKENTNGNLPQQKQEDVAVNIQEQKIIEPIGHATTYASPGIKTDVNDPHVTIIDVGSSRNRSFPEPEPEGKDLSGSAKENVEYASNNENKKLRGFFRKATRFIERTTNVNPANDDNKVLIGGMAVSLK